MTNSWNIIKLSNIAELIKNTVMPNSIDCPYIGLEHIEQETLRLSSIGHSSDVNSTKYCFQQNDILFGKLRPYFRKVVKPQFGGICSTDIFVIRAKPNIDQNFLFYLLSNCDFINIATVSNKGTRMPRADWSYLSTIQLNIPPLPEQKAIASVLSSLDDKIDLLHRQNKTLDSIAETLFRHYFAENPNPAWQQQSLTSVAQFLNGLACQKYPPKNNFHRLPVLKIKELNNGISRDSDYASSSVDDDYIVKNGDIIFSWSGSLLIKIWFGDKCILNQHLYKVTSKLYHPWFYFQWCKYYLQDFIAIADSKATTMGHIKRSDLDKAFVLIPDTKTMDLLNSLFDPIIGKIINNNKQINILSYLRNLLLTNLISGEIRVDF